MENEELAQDVPEEQLDTEDTDVTEVEEQQEEYVAPEAQGQTYTADEVSALQQYVRQAAQQIQQYQQQLQQYELAGMDEDERQAAVLQQQQQSLSQREQQLQEWYATNQWYNYYKGWVPQEALQGQDPVSWQHSALTYLYQQSQAAMKESAKLKAENASLRKALNPGQQPPKVSTGSGAPVGKKSLWDMTWDEMESMKNAALLGQLDPNDYPSI